MKPLEEKLEHALWQLGEASGFNKARYQNAVLEISGRLLQQENGLERLYGFAPLCDKAGLFQGTDWENPEVLLPNLVKTTLESKDKGLITLEILSQLRLLAIANHELVKPGVAPEQAQHFLTQVMALNLSIVFDSGDEVLRERLGDFSGHIAALFQFHLNKIGFEDILGSLIDEIWRILSQRPVLVDTVKSMVTQIAIALSQGRGSPGETGIGADRLVSALFGPTHGCQDDPGVAGYEARLAIMDDSSLQQEAYGFARSMHDVGLVSDYHALFLTWLVENEKQNLIPDALGLSSTGLDVFRSYQELITALIREAVFVQTAQCIYGLALFIERGILYSPSIAPSLWRQMRLELSAYSKELLYLRFGDVLDPKVHLLSATLSLLGQPLGIGQGNNPTCQSARAISMWSYSQPDYLLYLIAQVSCTDSIAMHFEGQKILSAQLPDGLVSSTALDTGAVSVLLVPHLDRIYNEMGRMCAHRGQDPHKWINPEFHGWWVGREFLIAVDIATGRLREYDRFLKQFYNSYHPLYNGNQPIIHPQPAGLAVTDSNGVFVGWHAITLIRVALDQNGIMRVYFYNPNNDSGQNWGNGVVVSTQGYGERFGEASLPFEQMLSRVYIFHDDNSYIQGLSAPEDEIDKVKQMAYESWA
ncbi:MAG: hypothetical protein ACQERK_07790, partial [Campylobacterota bacterium]